MCGHHCATCVVAGVLGKRGSLLNAQLHRCAERQEPECPVREMDLAAHHNLDGRRLEVVANGLSLCGKAQLEIDTTLVSPLRRDGSARFRAADQDGAVLMEARCRKERTYPKLSGEGEQARLVVLPAEVGGWSDETAKFLAALAKAKAHTSPFILQNRVKAAYLRRWSAVLGCSAATASLLDEPVSGWGGDAPLVHEVVRDDHFEWRHVLWALLLVGALLTDISFLFARKKKNPGSGRTGANNFRKNVVSCTADQSAVTLWARGFKCVVQMPFEAGFELRLGCSEL